MAVALPAAPLHAAPPGSAVVQQIIGGNQMYIESRQARVKDRARTPQQVRTGDTRGQLGFDTGAVGRLNRFSQIRLGSSCFFLRGGQILVSGGQSGCVRSARLSVRGTHYVLTMPTPDGEVEVIVLEGQLQLQRSVNGVPTDEAGTTLVEGSKARIAADGRLLSVGKATAAEVAALLQGGLFSGFGRLPNEAALRSAIRRTWPDLPGFEGPSAPAPSAQSGARPEDSLMVAINAARAERGLAPLSPLPPELVARKLRYLQPVLAGVLRSRVCDHDLARWEGFQQEVVDGHALMPISEIIACPEPVRTWNADSILKRWLSSSLHFNILLNRPSHRYAGCAALEEANWKTAFCVFMREVNN